MNDHAPPSRTTRLTSLSLFAVIVVALIGYLVGLSDGVPIPNGIEAGSASRQQSDDAVNKDDHTIAAISYAEIPGSLTGPTAAFAKNPVRIPTKSDYDLFEKIEPSPADKAESSRIRSTRRAYNGAPPIIPHAIQGTSDSACYACHSNGIKMTGMKASVMSHPFLANCTQCHAPPPPTPFENVPASVENDFAGLAAPQAGKRAFPGAPPTIPHSQWMRENCDACHGGANGWKGMETTHPWRTNCTQCHAPSATLDQAVVATSAPMLPPPAIASTGPASPE